MVFQQNYGSIADCDNMVAIDKVFDQFPIGWQWTAAFGGWISQEDMWANAGHPTGQFFINLGALVKTTF